MNFIFRYLRYYWMILWGYQGRFLLADGREKSRQRWRLFEGSFTRHTPTKFVDTSEPYKKFWWYSTKELLLNFHNTSRAYMDRELDV